MYNNRSHNRGLTLVEIMVVLVNSSLLVGVLTVLVTSSAKFFRRMQARQQVAIQSRSCMERIEQLLRNGKARSLVISTHSVGPMRPNSQVDFVLQDALADGTTAYSIYLEGGTVFAQGVGTTPRAPQALASRVTSLMFSGDATDPAL